MKTTFIEDIKNTVKAGVTVAEIVVVSNIVLPVVAVREVAKWSKGAIDSFKEERRRKSYQVQWISVD